MVVVRLMVTNSGSGCIDGIGEATEAKADADATEAKADATEVAIVDALKLVMAISCWPRK